MAPRTMANAVTEPVRLSPEQHSIYTRHKRRLRIVREWLVNNASRKARKSTGIFLGSSQPKPNERTNDNPLDGAICLRPSQYLPLAHDIVRDSGKALVPAPIIDAISTVIRFRRVCCSWFSHSTDPETVRSNESHLAFVRILEQTLATLSPFREVVDNPAEVNNEEGDEIEFFKNKFESLTVSDDRSTNPIKDSSEVEPRGLAVSRERSTDLIKDPGQVDQRALASSDNSSPSPLGGSGKVEPQTEATRLWTPSATTISCLRRSGKAIEESARLITTSENANVASTFDLPKWYDVAYGLVWKARARIFQHDLTPDAKMKLQDFGEKIRHGDITCDLIDSEEVFLDRKNVQIQAPPLTLTGRDHTHRMLVPRSVSTLQVASSPPMHDVDMVADLDAIFKDGLSYCNDKYCCHTVHEDLVLGELRYAVRSNRPRLATAFAVAAFADIRKLDIPSAPCLEAVDKAAEAAEITEMTVYAQRAHMNHLQDHKEMNGHRLYSLEYVELTRNLRSNRRQGQVEIHQDPQAGLHGSLAVQKKIRSFLSQSPLACGSLSFRLQQDRLHRIIKQVDGSFVIRACLHFYNAALQRGDFKDVWHDMEYVIEAIGTKIVFLGDRPRTLEQCLSVCRLTVNLDVPLGDVYTGRRYMPRQKKEPKGLFEPRAVPFCIMAARVDEDERGLGISDIRGQLDIVMRALVKDPNVDVEVISDTDIVLQNQPFLEQQARRHRTADAVQLLDAAAARLRLEYKHFADGFDWLRLEAICLSLLRKLQLRYKIEALDELIGVSDAMANMYEYQSWNYTLMFALVQLAAADDGRYKQYRDRVKKMGGSWKDAEEASKTLEEDAKIGCLPYETSVGVMAEVIAQHGSDASRNCPKSKI
ncbi:uncharacterized protein AB675_10843 [Cyphellophora attinorum]|uniref:DUF6604 domain-containing protein n=1 Tax=Cyphellophora attinorum TaxID=1664694 RepID=A0A0N0NMT5_9EURO|nr:uncharacterized protein AB675_10843 [Phialophora attinorum]KPI40831.1 hypothetical protein AB675_10843 [Phialophora attinorum]